MHFSLRLPNSWETVTLKLWTMFVYYSEMLHYCFAKIIFSTFASRHMNQSWLHSQRSDLARQPHAWWLQQKNSSLQWTPPEVTSTTANSVDVGVRTPVVPESTAVEHCTVVHVGSVTCGPRVVVTVIRGEHHSVVITECVTSVTWVPRC